MWWIVTSDDLGAIDCGCLLVARHSQTTAELIYLGVGPEYRGRGFGKALLEDLKARMADLGICRLLLAVDLDNLPAIKIYESVGFVQLGVAEVWFKPMGEVSG